MRRAVPEDAQPVALLLEAALPDAWPLASVAAELSRADGEIWILEDDGRLVAVAIVRSVLDEAELLAIGVSPHCLRRGYGRALGRAALQAMQGRIERVHLEVRESNAAARGLYLALGFIEVGRRRDYYSSPPEDALLMTLWMER